MRDVNMPRWLVEALVAFLTDHIAHEERLEFGSLLKKLEYGLAKTMAQQISESFSLEEVHQMYIIMAEMQFCLGKLRGELFLAKHRSAQTV